MNDDHNACEGLLTTSAITGTTSTGFRPSSDKTLIASLLIGANLLLFAFVQSSNMRFEKGDFKMFYAAAIALRSGQNVYDPDIYPPLQRKVIPTLRLADIKPYTHPPYELLVILPFSFLPYEVACWCWLLLILILGIICSRLIGSYLAVFGMFPFLIIMCEQQDPILALILLSCCWFAVKNNHELLAGLILGLALFRFQIVIPFVLLLGFWRPRVLKGTTISGLAVFALCVAMVGPAGMMAYCRYLVGMMEASYSTNSAYHMDPRQNVGLRGFVYELVGPHVYFVSMITVITGLLIFAIAWWFMRNAKPSREAKFSFAVLASVLLSFHLMIHDLILLSLPFVLLAGSMARWPLATLYAVPIALVLIPHPTAWLALVPISGFAAISLAYWDRPPKFAYRFLRWDAKRTATVLGGRCD